MAKSTKNTRYCMFCGRRENEVSLLLQGLDACICADCVKMAGDYIKDFSGDTTARYVRYIVPDGEPQNIWNKDNVYCCNIAEMKIYGESAGTAAVMGGVNKDGIFSIADAVMLQKWLLNVPDATLTDWKSADLCADGIINVFDFCKIRELLVAQ